MLKWEYCTQFQVNLMEQVHTRATKMIKGPKHLSYEDMLRAGNLQPREEKAQGHFIDAYKYLVEVNEHDGARFSSATEHEVVDTN